MDDRLGRLGVKSASRLLGQECLNGNLVAILVIERFFLSTLGITLALGRIHKTTSETQEHGKRGGIVVCAAHVRHKAVDNDADSADKQEYADHQAGDPQAKVNRIGPGKRQHAHHEEHGHDDHAVIDALLENGHDVDQSGHGFGLCAHGVHMCDDDDLATAALACHRARNVASNDVLGDTAGERLGQDGVAEPLGKVKDHRGHNQKQAKGIKGGGQTRHERSESGENSAADDQKKAQRIRPANARGRGKLIDANLETRFLQVLCNVKGSLVFFLCTNRARTDVIGQRLNMFHEFGHRKGPSSGNRV